MRIDKFLWAVRVYRTRTVATDRIREGKVELSGEQVKPSREVKVGEEVRVKRGAVVFGYLVKELPKGRVGPKLVDYYIDDITSEVELEKARAIRESQRNNQFFQGRPTKKVRRDWSKFTD